MPLVLDTSCVYTIAIPERLAEASKFGTPLPESKRWVKAAALLDSARQNGTELPIAFADARNCSALLAWSTLNSIALRDSGTQYTIGSLWKVPSGTTPQDLQLLASGEFIADGHIRPYVLCRTPFFLRKQAQAPRPWVQPRSLLKEAQEGARRLSEHMRRERSAALVMAAKKAWMEKCNGRLPCQVCGFDFLAAYGPIGAGFAEAHHKELLATSPEKGRKTAVEELAIVCANCHRMLHREPDFPSMESLRGRVRHAEKKSRSPKVTP